MTHLYIVILLFGICWLPKQSEAIDLCIFIPDACGGQNFNNQNGREDSINIPNVVEARNFY